MKIVKIFIILHRLSCVFPEEAIVFPRLLEEKSEGGKRIVLVNEDLHLELQKASILAETVLIEGFSERNFALRMKNGTELEENLYEDREKFASVIMIKNDEGITLEGMLTEQLKIEPLPMMPRMPGKGLPHKISRIELPPLAKASDSDLAVKNTSKLHLLENRQVASAPLIVCELFILVDSVYGITFHNLFTYLIALLNAVKLRFTLLSDPFVTIRIVGMYRLTYQEESLIYSYSLGYVLAEQSLRNLYRFLRQRPVFGNPDFFYLFSGRDLAEMNGQNLDITLMGMTFVAVMCGFNNVGVGEDKPGTYQGVRVTAHELAHAFGSVHDGEGPLAHIPNHPGSKFPECAWEHGYMMSYIEKDAKSFHFSPCCKLQMKVFFRLLSADCLAIQFRYDYFINSENKLPGDYFDGNLFCKNHHPSSPSVYFPQPQDPLDLLQCRIQCIVRTDAYGNYIYYPHFAPEGLTCYGERATCRHGECRFW
ncbi:venom metalloproteinase antarease-like TtrivMP_A [Ixodes scapularis]|uniref:venom metalloproteinase antarease-like TtrivMP_A n=1 Tax=Ixodes scapularis TaxID=6945 RepID=UPI001A9E03D6|nr:venom metalloproteinase antarease-like TtrivMP_A [Ixodes scapularis]